MGSQAAVIVFTVAGDIEPNAAPTLAVVWRSEQAVNQPSRIAVGGRVFFKSINFFREWEGDR